MGGTELKVRSCRGNMLGFLTKIVVIGGLHWVAGALLYRGRVVNHLPLLQSDLFVFLLPALIATIAYGVVFWSSEFLQAKPALRLAITFVFSLLATGLSSWLFMLVAFNTYGT